MDQGAAGAAKVHPATREMLPDDPLSLTGVEVPGDADLMLRLLVEEYARIGYDLDAIVSLARDPFFVAFHGLLLAFGEDGLRQRVAEVLGRVGVLRIVATETIPASTRLVRVERAVPRDSEPREEPPCHV